MERKMVKAITAREDALAELRAESEELYQKAIQVHLYGTVNSISPLTVAPGAKTQFLRDASMKNIQMGNFIFWRKWVKYCMKTRINIIICLLSH